MKHLPIPSDYEVQPLKPGQHARHRCTCGECGLSWDDGISTSITPTPSAQCPFESFHLHPEEDISTPSIEEIFNYIDDSQGNDDIDTTNARQQYTALIEALEGLLASAPEPDKNIRKSYSYRVNIETARKALMIAKGEVFHRDYEENPKP